MYECECHGPGYCERHKAEKTLRDWKLCQGIDCPLRLSMEYRQLWDRRSGVGDPAIPANVPSTPCRVVKKGPETTVTVGIVCHNYGRFLAECVASIRAQEYPITQVFVVDDASEDDTAKVCDDLKIERIAVSVRDVYLARKAGYERATGDVICFLDADDVLPADYVSRGIREFNDPRVAVVYSDLEKFGDQEWKSNYPNFSQESLSRRNFMHSGSLVRRDALRLSRAYDGPTSQSPAHADWMVWKRIARAGYVARKQQAVYRYRQHGQNMLTNLGDLTYYEMANLHEQPVTLFVPLSGRSRYWLEFSQNLEKIVTAATQPISLVLLDTSHDSEFSEAVRDWASTANLTDVRYVHQRVGEPGQADEDRHDPVTMQKVRTSCAMIYNWLRLNSPQEFTLILEDDIFPEEPEHLIEDLLRGFTEETDAVSGVYLSRYDNGKVLVYRDLGGMIDVEWMGDELERVQGAGFGCLMLRTSRLREIPMQDVPSKSSRNADFDLAFFQSLGRLGGVTKVDWRIRCRHAELSLPKYVPLPRAEWPIYARVVAQFRSDEDKGIGDTLARRLGGVGETFKKAFKTITGKDCGCGDRQRKLNHMYPY